MDCSPPGSSVHGIFQARIREWVAIPFSRGSPGPRERTQVSRIADRFSTAGATREATPNLAESSQNPTPLSWALIPVSSLDGGAWCTFQHLLQRSRSSHYLLSVSCLHGRASSPSSPSAPLCLKFFTSSMPEVPISPFLNKTKQTPPKEAISQTLDENSTVQSLALPEAYLQEREV